MIMASQVVAAGTRFGGTGYGLLGLILALMFAFGCRAIAKRKGRGGIRWFILGFLFHILTLIVIALLPDRRSVRY